MRKSKAHKTRSFLILTGSGLPQSSLLLLVLPDLPDLVEEDLPDLPLHQSDRLSFSDEGAFDAVGEADHQPSLLLFLRGLGTA